MPCAHRPSALLTAAALLGPLLAAAAEVQAAGLVGCNPAPIVILEGQELPEALGADLTHLRFISWDGQGWQPRPLQVDERDRKGRYLFHREADDDGGPGELNTRLPGTLSELDEILLMPAWAGEPPGGVTPPPGRWWKVAGQSAGESQTWGYLGLPQQPMPPFDADAVTVETAAHASASPGAWIMRYGADGQSPFPTDFVVPPRSTGGPPSVDFLEHTGLSFGFTTRGAELNFSRDEGQVRRELDAYTDGPIRVLLSDRYSVWLLSWLASPSASVVMKLYPQCVEVPASINVPFDPDVLLSQAGARAYFTLSPELTSADIWPSSGGEAIKVPAPGEERHFAMTQAVVIDGPAIEPLTLKMAYPQAEWSALGIVTDLSLSTAATSGAPTFDLIWNITGLEKLPKGTHDGSLQIILGRLPAQPPSVRLEPVTPGLAAN